MRWTDEMRMETPEQIDLDLELSGVGTRCAAKVVDWLLKMIGTVVIGLVVVLILIALKSQDVFENPSTLLIVIAIVALFFLWFCYEVFFTVRWNGETPGKRLLGIRVIRESGAPVDFNAAAIRSLLGFADMLPAYYLLGAILVLLTARNQRLGDIAAGTIVIRERRADLNVDADHDLLEYASEEYSFTQEQLSHLSAADRTILREYLRRNQDMERGERSRLARKLVETYLKKTGYELDDHTLKSSAARAFLASLLRDLEQSLKHR